MAPSRDQRRLSLCVLLLVQVLQARRRRLREERIRRARARLERFRRFCQRQRSERAMFLATLATLVTEVNPPAERRMWVINRNSDWWETNDSWTEMEWLENLRMTKNTFEFLCDELSETLRKETTKMRTPIPVNKRVALTVWKMATNADYRTIERVFGVAKSTICKILREVCKAIVDQFFEDYVRFANSAGLRAIADGFEQRWGLPQCVGAVDSIHIPILTPTNDSPSGQCNPGGWRSIMAQITVDDDYCISDLHVADVGKISDADFFATTPLYRYGNEGSLFPTLAREADGSEEALACRPRTIGGMEVPYFLAADEHFPLLNWVMTPYPEEDPEQFGSEEEAFNERLEDVHHVAQEAWTRLKGRWRCLQTRNDGMVDFVVLAVRACCVLHNICERNKHPFLQEWATAAATTNDFKFDAVQPLNFVDDVRRNGSTESQKIRRAIAGCVIRTDGMGASSSPLGGDVYDEADDESL